MTNRKGTLIVLSGPSGTGKGTVLKHFFDNYADDAVKLSISATTRLPRDGETDGVNYFFVEKEKFENMISGATNSAIVNKFLNYIIENVDIVLSVGGAIFGILDYIFDKSINNVIWKFKLW